MKKLLSKNATKKLLIIILIVISFNFIVPNYSHADWGGVLLGPIVDLVAAIGDVGMAALQYFMYDGNISLNGASVFGLTVPKTVFNPADYNMQVDDELITSEITPETLESIGGGVAIYEDTLSEISWWTAAINWFGDGFGYIFGIEDTEYQAAAEESPYGIPIIRYSPEKIFSNQVPSLDVNFINPKEWEGVDEEATEAMNERSVTQVLHETVASWYVVLRNLAIIALLSVLLYVGIRMIISSTASDKAKYKQMFMDWLVALCILFFLHYIMSFILTFVDTLATSISDATGDVVIGVFDNQESGQIVRNVIDDAPIIFETDLAGYCRMLVQSRDLMVKVVYLIMYVALVIYTFMFTWTYVKRAITMAFLTLIAPLIAITYPIDKISDGQAQAFNVWIKEFIFNALLQPFHLILYTIFLGSSMEIAVKNPIYAILFLAFIIPSEKLLRRMFGFDKAETAGSMSTAAGLFGGAAVLKSAGNLVGKLRGGGKKGTENGNDVKAKKQLRTKNNPVTDPNTPSLTSAFGSGKTNNRRINNRNARANNRSERNRNGRIADDNRRSSSGGQQIQSQQTQRRQRALADGNRRPIRLANARNGDNNNNSNIIPRSNTNRYRIRRISGANSTRDLAEQNNNEPQRRTKGHFIRGAVGVAGNAALGAAKFAGRTAAKTIKTAGGLAVAGVGVGIGGVVGVAAGITDGPDDVLKSAGTGMAIGATGGTAMAAIGGSAIGAAGNLTRRIPGIVRDTRDTYEKSAYGNVEAALRSQARELMKDEDYKQQVAISLEKDSGVKPSSREVKAAMQVGTEYYNSGITETKDIIKAMKTEKNIKQDIKQNIKNQYINQGMSEEAAETAADKEAGYKAREQSKVVTKMATKIDNSELRDKEQAKGIRKSIQKQLLSKIDMSSMNEEEKSEAKKQAKQQAKNIIDLIKQQKGII